MRLVRAGKAHVKVLGRSAACSVMFVLAARSEMGSPTSEQLGKEQQDGIEFTECIAMKRQCVAAHECRVNQKEGTADAADGRPSQCSMLVVGESHAGGRHGSDCG